LYPFPEVARQIYEELYAELSELNPSVYVYPFWETHVTIATLVNFTRQISPTVESIHALKNLISEIASALAPALKEPLKPFDLWIEQPVISRNAAILPLSDPTGAVSKIRKRVVESLAAEPALRERLNELGLNIPPLVHSTIMRFKHVPANTRHFLSTFDQISRAVPRTLMRVEEIYLTTETKPYMREGEIVSRLMMVRSHL
jgi:hypothetical protein